MTRHFLAYWATAAVIVVALTLNIAMAAHLVVTGSEGGAAAAILRTMAAFAGAVALWLARPRD